MILVADCHAGPRHGNEAEFFALLERVAQTAHDVVFLGDILDFWIALPRYEQALHRRFLEWCRTEAQRRTVGFVEGNHEFFLAHSHASAFTFCVTDEHVDAAGRLFVHGDTINRGDRPYLRFRRLVKSPAVRWLELLLPGAPAVARAIKRRFERRGRAWPKRFPEAHVEAFGQHWFERGVQAVYLGHFHDGRVLTPAAGRLVQVIPAWHGSGLVGVLSEDSQVAVLRPGRELRPD